MPRCRMRSSWGNVTEERRGVWRLRYWAETPEGYRRCSETVRGTRKQAEDRLAQLRIDHSADAPAPTVGQVWSRWYLPDLQRQVIEGDRAKGTLLAYEGSWRKHIAPRWADVPVDQIQALFVQQWLSSLGYSAANSSLAVLRPLIDYAVRYGCCETNVFRVKYVMPSKSSVAHMDTGIWTLPEMGKLWSSIHGEWFEGAFLLAGFCGLRVGESLGVRVEDIEDVSSDIPLALVHVQRQVLNSNSAISETLKNPQSVRVVPVAGKVAQALLSWNSGSAWVTTDGLGSYETQSRLNTAWRELLAGSELHHPFRNLRNSYQTWMRWDMRIAPYFIETMMGHKVAGVTGEHYDRPVGEMLSEVVADAYRAHPFDATWNC